MKQTKKIIGIYFYDPVYFKDLFNEVQKLWYRKFGVTLTTGALLIKAVQYLKEYLSGERDTNDNKRQDIHKYSRTGLSDK